jgi:hypothetical protein
MRAPTRTSMMSRVSRHHGTLRHSSSSIVGPPHIEASLPFPTPSLWVCLIYFHFSFLWSPICVSSLILVAIISFFSAVLLYYCYRPQILFNLTALHSFTPFFFCYAHFIHNPRSLAFIFIFCITLVTGEQFTVTQRASPLAYPFISPDFPLSLPFSPSSLSYIVPRPTHAPASRIRTTHIVSYAPLAFISISAGLEIEALIKIGVQVFFHSWREERFVFGAWGDHVACIQIRLC